LIPDRMACKFVNKAGIQCPRSACVGDGCLRHSCQICGALTVQEGYCAQHKQGVPKKNHIYDDGPNQCEYVTRTGQCPNHTYDTYCQVHRCAHGSQTFRGEMHCHHKVVDGGKYCVNHHNSCDCYWDEDDTGCGVCCEDIHQCTRAAMVYTPKRMCEFHYKLFLFEKADEY
jgi:hypothetical protein